MYIVIPHGHRPGGYAAQLLHRGGRRRRRGAGEDRPAGHPRLLGTLVLLFSFQDGRSSLATGDHPAGGAIAAADPADRDQLLASAGACRVRHAIARPAALIGASSFFELAVAVAIVLYGFHSGAALATVVGVLIEVPLMLWLVHPGQPQPGLVQAR